MAESNTTVTGRNWLSGRISVQIFTILPMFCLGHGVYAQEVPVEVVTFTQPTVENLVQPTYPSAAVQKGIEGYVDFNFMVDTEGRVFEPVVSDSSGEKSLQDAALRALRNSRFKPGMLNGEPIIAANTMRYNFTLEGDTGGRESFVRAYRNLANAMARDDAEKISVSLAALERVGAINHYEQAFLYLSRYSYAIRYGTELEQMKYLHGALSFADSEDDVVHMKDENQTDLWRALLTLQLKNRYFADALKTWKIMQSRKDDEGIAMYGPVIDAINNLKNDDNEFAVALEVPESGFFWHSLLKRRFYITGGDGKVLETALYCNTKYTSILLERDVDYELPRAWGDCVARFIGDSGATFQLVQH